MKGRNQESIAALAIPIVLGNIFTFLIGFCDHLLCSELSRSAVSAIYICNQIALFVQYASVGIESVTVTLVRRCYKSGRYDDGAATLAISTAIALFISVLTTIICIMAPKFLLGFLNRDSEILDTGAPFLRILSLSFPIFMLNRLVVAEGKSHGAADAALLSPALAFFVNLVFGLFFVRGAMGAPSLGELGAAWATVIARSAELLLSLALSFFGRKRSARPTIAAIRRGIAPYFSFFLPIFASQAALAATSLFTTAILSRGSAAFGVSNTLFNLAYTVISGISSSVGILVSGFVEVGDRARLSAVTRRADRIFAGAGLFLGFFIVFATPPLTYLFSAEDIFHEVFALSIINAVTFPATSYAAGSLFGIIKSGGDASFAMRLDLAVFFLYTLPLGLLGARLNIPPFALLALLRTEFILRSHIISRRITSGRWISQAHKRGVDKTAI